jgi:hypothetical protein
MEDPLLLQINLRNRALGAVALLAAAVLAVGRVAIGVHFPSDVLAGALLGSAVALALFARPLRARIDGLADRVGGWIEAAIQRLPRARSLLEPEEREVMNRIRKLVLTVAALAALAVGGAAFAQAQSSGSAAPAQSAAPAKSAEAATPGDPADAPNAEDQRQSDQGESGESPDGPQDDHGADTGVEDGA